MEETFEVIMFEGEIRISKMYVNQNKLLVIVDLMTDHYNKYKDSKKLQFITYTQRA